MFVLSEFVDPKYLPNTRNYKSAPAWKAAAQWMTGVIDSSVDGFATNAVIGATGGAAGGFVGGSLGAWMNF